MFHNSSPRLHHLPQIIPQNHPTLLMFSHFSCVRLFSCDPMKCSLQGPLSMEFPRQEYWSGLPCPPPGDLANPGIKPSSALQVDSLPAEPPGKLTPSPCHLNKEPPSRKQAFPGVRAVLATLFPGHLVPLGPLLSRAGTLGKPSTQFSARAMGGHLWSMGAYGDQDTRPRRL